MITPAKRNGLELKGLPLYNVDASFACCSFDDLMKEENPVGRYNVPDLMSADLLTYVRGDSMYPKYSNKDIVACKIIRERHFILWNKPHVIATREQGLLVKRIRESENKDAILAVSDNQSYPPSKSPTATSLASP